MAKKSKKKVSVVTEAGEVSQEIKEDVVKEIEAEVAQAEVVEEKELIPPKRKFLNKKLVLVVLIVALILLVPVVYLYWQYNSSQSLLGASGGNVNAQEASLVSAVGKLMLLPAGETPKIATVSDASQLSGQSFFARAQNGDKVLIYEGAGKAILYRPSINKIIDVSAINMASANQANQQPVASSSATAPAVQNQQASAVILNGTQTIGLAKAAQTKIQGSLSNISILSLGDSINGNYDTTIVIDLTGNKAQAAQQLATLLRGKVESKVPAGENTPKADLLVILGSNYIK